jgi:hypothetical protein
MVAAPAQNFDVEVQPEITSYGNGIVGAKLGEKSLYVSPKPATIQITKPTEATWFSADSLPSITEATTDYVRTDRVYTYRTNFAQGAATTAATNWNLNIVRDNFARTISTDYGISYGDATTTISGDSISVGTWGTSAGTTNEYRIYVTATDATTFTISGSSIVSGAIDLADSIKEIIRSNLLIKTGRSRSHLPTQVSGQELKARDTLRDMLTEAEWRRYVTNGFIMVKGRAGFTSPKFGVGISQKMSGSSLWYQIFNDRRRVKVFQDGKEFAQICIHTVNECPPSDHVINMKVLVELDEDMIWQGGNPHFQNDLSASLSSGSLSFDSGEGSLSERVKRLRENFGLAIA